MAFLIGATGTGGYILLRLQGEDWVPGPGEILSAPPDEALYGTVWLLAAALTAWPALSTAVAAAAYASRLPGAVRAVEWMTLPPLRRLARRSVAILLALGGVSTAPAAGAVQPPPVPVEVGVDQPSPPPAPAGDRPATGLAGVDTPVEIRVARPIAGTPSAAISPSAAPEGGVAAPAPLPGDRGQHPYGSLTYTVRAGDDMWSVTVAYLAREGEEAPSPDAVARAWRELVESNRDRIRSGDPDLIFPGEQLFLPWPSVADRR